MSEYNIDLARRAADRLTPDYGIDLVRIIDARSLQEGTQTTFEPITTTVAVATLILNVAKFAWDIYVQRKKNGKPADAGMISREIRVKLSLSTDVSELDRDKVVDAVVEELLKAPPAD